MTRIAYLTAAVLSVATASRLASQEMAPGAMVDESLRNHLERSYITFTGGLGNGPAVWFEGNIAPPFVVIDQNRWGLVLTPKVILRMMRTNSAPVRTPSYMPRLSGYYRLSSQGDSSSYLFATISHHSNGQDGDFFNPDGTINDRDGSFSTNFLEIGFQRVLPDDEGIGHSRLSVEYHPPPLMDEHLRPLYSKFRVHVGGSYSFADRTTGAIDVTYLADPTPYTRKIQDRFQVGVNTTITQPWLSEIAFLVNAYYGQDYYNMQFQRRVTMLRFGIVTTPSRGRNARVALPR